MTLQRASTRAPGVVGSWGLYSPAEPPGTQPSPPTGDPPTSPTTAGTRAGVMEHLPSALSPCPWCPWGPEEQEQSPKPPTPSRRPEGSWWSHLPAKGTT